MRHRQDTLTGCDTSSESGEVTAIEDEAVAMTRRSTFQCSSRLRREQWRNAMMHNRLQVAFCVWVDFGGLRHSLECVGVLSSHISMLISLTSARSENSAIPSDAALVGCTSSCKMNGRFSVEIHHFSRAILQYLCIFNRKFQGNIAFLFQFVYPRRNRRALNQHPGTTRCGRS